ncbi:MAG: ABC transporter substrate-binding protein [Propionibacteriaceae bacterium]|jgi:iron complex transport system substrate-binding protein|nr:ABC transporter substrate-binding protein [Propionibacteriaceae bacterium]
MRQRLGAWLALVLFATTALAGCGDSSKDPTTAPSDSAGITLTDMMGQTVTLSGPAQKVVSLTASDVEILYAIGAGDTVVGRGEFCDYPAEVLQVPAVQSGNDTNIEQIIALDPDLVVMGTMAQSQEQSDQLRQAGIAVLATDADDIASTYQAIELLGQATGRPSQAQAVVDQMRTTFADLSAQASARASQPKPTIYYEISPLEYGLWAAGRGTFMDEVGQLLQLDNIFGDLEGWAEVSQEQVLERQPDYILTVAMYFGEGPTPIESILSRQGWEQVPAVADDAILNLQQDELSRPGPRLAAGAQLLYDFVYGA